MESGKSSKAKSIPPLNGRIHASYLIVPGTELPEIAWTTAGYLKMEFKSQFCDQLQVADSQTFLGHCPIYES